MLPINKSHLRFNSDLGYVVSQMNETPLEARGSGGPR
jgi:hypothetical protein